jgi:endonuclease G
MSKVTFAIIAAGGAAAGAAATAALYSTKKNSYPPTPVSTTTTTTVTGPGRPAPLPSIPSPASAARRPPVDPNGVFQYGFPGPVNDLRPAASLTSTYDRRTRNPAWVAEHITPESLASKNASTVSL